MKKVILLLIFFMMSTLSLHAQQDDQFQKQMEEILKARAEMLKSLMDDSDFGSSDMEKHMQEMIKRFATPGFGNSGMGFGFDDESSIVGEYDWLESSTHKILKIKVQQIKDHPLDIKIEKGNLKIKGDVETSEVRGKSTLKRKVNFERSFRLPDDVDQNNPEFENKNNEMLISFKKLKRSDGARNAPAKKPSPKRDERVPVTPGTEDLTI